MTLTGKIFAFIAIPAIPIPLFTFAAAVPATEVP